jgi:Flp pilus assembly protein TadD
MTAVPIAVPIVSELPRDVTDLLAAVREAPRDAGAWRALVGALLHAGELAAARRALERARKSLPPGTGLPDLEARLALRTGQRLLRQGRDLEALATLDGAAALLDADVDAWQLRALVLGHLGRFEEAGIACERALELAPRNATALSNLGAALNDVRRFRAAEAWLRRALERDAAAVGARVNLAVSLQGQDRLAEMARELDCLPRDLPDDASLLVSVGTLHVRARRPSEALALLERATALAPDAGEAWQAAGLACQMAGRLDDAVERFRRALGLWLAGRWLPVRLDGEVRASMSAPAVPASAAEGAPAAGSAGAPAPAAPGAGDFTGRAHRALLDAGRLLDAAQLPFFLAFGTLLGVVRNGDLLSFDKDVDLGLWWNADRARVQASLTGDRTFRLSGETSLASEAQRRRQLSLVHVPTGVSVDLDFFRIDGAHAVAGIDHRPVPLECRLRRFGLRELDFLGRRWRIPDPPERFLEDMYGPDWRTPQPLFDAVVSARCLAPESVPVALCFGWARLLMRLRSGDRRRAAAYCRQLLDHRPDPLLEQALARLEAGAPAGAA